MSNFMPRDKKGIRLMYHANAPWAKTGYGVQSNSLLPRLAKLPEIEEIALLSYYGIAGGVTEQEIGLDVPVDKIKVTCYPARSDPWGNDVIGDHTTVFDADMTITLFDLWPLAAEFGWTGSRWCPWFPIDHEPVPPQVLERSASTYENLVYSKSAVQELLNNNVKHTYIPHGVETTLFKPLGEEERKAAKRWLGFPDDCFLVGTVGANKGYPPRKGWNEMFTAMAEFLRTSSEPDKVYFYQHSLMTGEHGGPDLQQMAADFGLGERIRFANPYKLQSDGMTNDEMNRIYNAMDVFILLSRGEGFGIPILEAQACGTPVIVTDWTAMRELGEVGYKIPIVHREWTPQRSWWGIANPAAASLALSEVQNLWLAGGKGWGTAYADLRAKARAFALPYDWQSLVDNHWAPFMTRMWNEIKPRVWGPVQKVWEDPKFGIPEVEEEERAIRTIGGNGTADSRELVPTPN